jgi:hypothetical protein
MMSLKRVHKFFYTRIDLREENKFLILFSQFFFLLGTKNSFPGLFYIGLRILLPTQIQLLGIENPTVQK